MNYYCPNCRPDNRPNGVSDESKSGAAVRSSELVRLPKLRRLRDSNPMTGQIWVVDENDHMVASFKIMRRECHLSGSKTENVDAGLNMEMADQLIEQLAALWGKQPNDPSSATA